MPGILTSKIRHAAVSFLSDARYSSAETKTATLKPTASIKALAPERADSSSSTIAISAFRRRFGSFPDLPAPGGFTCAVSAANRLLAMNCLMRSSLLRFQFFVDEEREALPKFIAVSQFQPALFREQIIRAQRLVLGNFGVTSALFGLSIA